MTCTMYLLTLNLLCNIFNQALFGNQLLMEISHLEEYLSVLYMCFVVIKPMIHS